MGLFLYTYLKLSDMKIKKKIRIQAFDNEGFQLEDRLVEQDIEFTQGPKKVHKGPLRVEVNLFEQSDVDGFINYLKKLQGELPLETPGKYKPKKASPTSAMEPQHREIIIENILEIKTQDEAIKYLRSEGFEFLTFDYINSLNLETGISEEHQEKYQWMLKVIKKAKNPLNNKYDPTLCFGFKLVGKKIGTYVIYLYTQKHKVVKCEWDDKQKVSFKNTEMIKFPPYMIQEERDKFRVEIYQLRNNPDKLPSKFFKRWAKDVEFKDKNLILKREDDSTD